MEFKPYEYQQACIDRLLTDNAVGLFLRPGLGKTVITLTAAQELRCNRFEVNKCLVIAPKTVAEGTWATEARKWDHLSGLRVVPVLGDARKRVRALCTPGDVYVLGRDSVTWLVDYYKQDWPFDMLVIDESTSFKNSQAKRFKALKLIRRFVSRIVLLTGTPVSRDLEDLWGQAYLLDGGARLGRTLTAFRDMYMHCNTHGGHYTEYRAKDGAFDSAMQALSDICISMSAEDYLQLPERVDETIHVQLDAKDKKKYDEFEREMLLELDEAVITAASAGVLTGKLLQFASGCIYDEAGEVVQLHEAKLDACMDLIERIREPCLVFYGFRHEKERLMARFKAAGLRAAVYEDSRDAEAWNSGGLDVLLAHPASCAYGLNLQQGGRNIVWYTPNWSFELNDQGVCRLLRQGSPFKSIFVFRLVVGGTVDEDVIEAVNARQGTHDAVMTALKARIAAVKRGG